MARYEVRNVGGRAKDKKGEEENMLTRRTFIRNAGTMAAAATIGITAPESEIKEHGIVDIQADIFGEPIIMKATIFSNGPRDIFGIRFLGERGSCDLRLAELPLSAVRETLATPGRPMRCVARTWTGNGTKQEVPLDLMADATKLSITDAGKLKDAPPWISLSDIRRVL